MMTLPQVVLLMAVTGALLYALFGLIDRFIMGEAVGTTTKEDAVSTTETGAVTPTTRPQHHPECGKGYPEKGCHRECGIVLHGNAVLAEAKARRLAAGAGTPMLTANPEELLRQLGEAMGAADARMGQVLVGYAFLREVRDALSTALSAPAQTGDALRDAVRDFLAAEEAVDREAERTRDNPAGWSSGPVVRRIKAVETLRAALRGSPAPQGERMIGARSIVEDLIRDCDEGVADGFRAEVVVTRSTLLQILSALAPSPVEPRTPTTDKEA